MKLYYKLLKLNYILLIIFLTFQIEITAFASADPSFSSPNFQGSGNELDPYQISSFEDLSTFRDLVDSGNNFTDSYFIQTADIVMPDSEMWDPIGEASAGITFNGYYDGNGHVIHNLLVDDPFGGFFSYLSGEVRNLGIESGTIRGDCLGGITSHGSASAKIINCYSKAGLYPNVRAGGIADNCPAKIISCWSILGNENDAEKALISGISSYGDALVINCRSLGFDRLTSETDFQGKIIDSYLIDETAAPDHMAASHEELWKIHSDPELYGLDGTCICADNLRFINWTAQTICFSEPGFLPDGFLTESQTARDRFSYLNSNKYGYEGSGTLKDPFLISSYEDLALLRDCVNIGVNYNGYYFSQTADITFPDNVNWKPIGIISEVMPFSGCYNGNGHVLHSIHCDYWNAGLFAYLDGTVINLGIEDDCCFTGNSAAGIANIAGLNSAIINCYNKAAVSGETYAGGLTVYCYGELLYSWNSGTTAKLRDAAGTAEFAVHGTGKIDYCFAPESDSVLVYSPGFSGTMENSGFASSSQTDKTLSMIHGQQNKERPPLRPGITALNVKNNTLSFDAGASPKAASDDMFSALPIGFLAVFCLIFGFMMIKMIHRPEKEQRNNAGYEAISENILSKEQKYPFLLKRITAVLLTTVMILVPFSSLIKVLKNKNDDGILTIQEYYRQPEGKIDLLLLGSSRSGLDFDGEILWNEYGISSYNLWGSRQPFWNSYYFLKEAVRVNKPKIVVLEVTAATYQEEYAINYRQITNTLGIKGLINHTASVLVSCAPKDYTDFLLQFPLYHERYTELSRNDFIKFSKQGAGVFNNGYFTLYGSGPAILQDGRKQSAYRAIEEKEEYYLRKITEFCRDQSIPLLFLKTQAVSWKSEQPYYNTLRLIADEYGIPFLNFNELSDEIGFVPTDIYTDKEHLNTVGARKNSIYLGNYLMTNYDLKNHPGNSDYSNWNIISSQLTDEYIGKITDIDEYLSEITRDHKKMIVLPYRTGANAVETHPAYAQFDSGSTEFWDKEDTLYDPEKEFELSLDKANLLIRKDYTYLKISTSSGGQLAEITQPGIVFIVYDPASGSVADISLLPLDGKELTHLIQ